MFDSARFKLTAFYLAVLLCFSLTLTIGIRMLAQSEFDRSSYAQRHEVVRLFGALVSLPTRPTENAFTSWQQDQDDIVRQHLNNDLLLLNLAALVIGGVVSYWYAGRTLKPIIEAHNAQKRFASDASHELRTPLANMQVENEVFLRQKSFTEPDARALITSNLEEVQRLESLANNLLQLTQYEHAELKLSAVSVQKLVDDALAHSAKALDSRKVRVDKKLVAAKILGEYESLERLLGIIIDNAVKYGPQQGTIFITGKKSSTCYRLSVRDEGSGIAPDDLPHIFDRLYRGDKARSSKAEGYGLGLSLAKQIAIANNATITATNAKTGGAEFTVALPLVRAGKS
jgi:two-component system, OmpR family, sensor histidine kinase CiaH